MNTPIIEAQPVDLGLLTGMTQAHLEDLGDQPGLVHRDVISALLQLQYQAADAGFKLRIASGFRAFERQLQIWNAKASGQRPVLDADSRPLDMTTLSDLEQVHAIMRWSALPGGSRHHWGTDFDVWDTSAVPLDYVLQLTPDEYRGDGPFASLSSWLDEHLPDSGFFRPYDRDRGGVAPEPWHLSYRPLAEQFARQLTPERLAEALKPMDLVHKSVVLAHMDELFERYILID